MEGAGAGTPQPGSVLVMAFIRPLFYGCALTSAHRRLWAHAPTRIGTRQSTPQKIISSLPQKSLPDEGEQCNASFRFLAGLSVN